MPATPRPLRRTTAAATTLLAATLALCACGGDEEQDTAGTRTVTGADGSEVEIPIEPERVVTLSEPTLDAALAVGVVPVGTSAGRGQDGASAYLAEAGGGDIPVVATTMEPDLEAIAELDPDLILVDETVGAKQMADQLNGIAPTVFASTQEDDWREAFTTAAGALNRADEAERVLAGLDAETEEVRGGLGANEGAVTSVIRWQDGAPSVVGQGRGHVGSILSALGLTRPESQQSEVQEHSVPISLEEIEQIDGDWLFFGTLGSREDGAAALDEAMGVSGFSGLHAVARDHVVVVDGSAWNSAGGPLAAGIVLDDVAAALTQPAG
ncbi:ABC transporter substrate-binding protein [Streptomyces hoynatensis]|uniref:ABC transporter substrate-binding protein n=1 Tax=Streptomyces hoynatensis TaxID=1141874 RepID=A0A3A9Z686_9ACTN|nr:ABC transporter substrate-binding protein [Streptomyces hoynatensis]RKN43818.1 ABC transporter substrate-binding protein [Streptomyces hoynatensis]